MSKNYAVIMAGGIGSRFWPKSRVAYPKQFIDILDIGQSLIQLTYNRFAKFIPKKNIFIVTNESYIGLVKEQLEGVADDNILLEPVRRNTAPCIAYACSKILHKEPEAKVVVGPSDHFIMDEAAFENAIKNAFKFLKTNHKTLITLGIKPTRPDTNYGYIQFFDDSANAGIHQVKTFTEKPDEQLAQTFLDSGDFLWNSGIFVWTAETIMKAFANHLPDIFDAFRDGKNFYGKPKENEFIKKAYALCTNISIDYGILEKSKNVYVIPSSFGWSDLGTWSSLYEKYEKDYVNNAVQGKNVMMYDSNNCMVLAPDEKLIVIEGLNDYCVVDTPDVLMILRRENEGRIKEINADIKLKKGERFL